MTVAYQKLEERGIRDGMTKSTRSVPDTCDPAKEAETERS